MRYTSLPFLKTLMVSSSLALAAAVFTSDASAQYESRSTLMGRIDKLERDIGLLQRQVSKGGSGGSARGSYSTGGDVSGSAAARLEVRISELEEQLRTIQGQIEQNAYQNKQLSGRLDQLQQDMEYRLGGASPMGSSPMGTSPVGSAPTPTAPAPAAQPPVDTMEPNAMPAPNAPQDIPADSTYRPASPTPASPTPNASPYESPTVGKLGVPAAPRSGAGGRLIFDNPRDHYNYAFKLLNQAKYDEAGYYFGQFVQNYPKDPLAGNAYYWLGETYYVRRDYVKSADFFRQGFESKPSGPKAADNLLKLSMSLNALGQNKEACVVLGQVVKKFGTNSESVRDRADQERNRIGCH